MLEWMVWRHSSAFWREKSSEDRLRLFDHHSQLWHISLGDTENPMFGIITKENTPWQLPNWRFRILQSHRTRLPGASIPGQNLPRSYCDLHQAVLYGENDLKSGYIARKIWTASWTPGNAARAEDEPPLPIFRWRTRGDQRVAKLIDAGISMFGFKYRRSQHPGRSFPSVLGSDGDWRAHMCSCCVLGSTACFHDPVHRAEPSSVVMREMPRHSQVRLTSSPTWGLHWKKLPGAVLSPELISQQPAQLHTNQNMLESWKIFWDHILCCFQIHRRCLDPPSIYSAFLGGICTWQAFLQSSMPRFQGYTFWFGRKARS